MGSGRLRNAERAAVGPLGAGLACSAAGRLPAAGNRSASKPRRPSRPADGTRADPTVTRRSVGLGGAAGPSLTCHDGPCIVRAGSRPGTSARRPRGGGEPIRAEDLPPDVEEHGDLERVPPYMASGTGIEASTIRH